MPPQRERTVIKPVANEAAAFAMEVRLIRKYGRKDLGTGCLRNRTDGGEGVSGRKLTLASRRAISKARTGMKFTEEHKAAIAAVRTGTKATLATREKMSRSRVGKRLPSEKTSMYGKHHKKSSRSKTAKSLRLWWAKKKENTCSTLT
jgi:hypothetical protein